MNRRSYGLDEAYLRPKPKSHNDKRISTMHRHLHTKHRATAFAKASGFDKALSKNKFYEGTDVFLATNESHNVLETSEVGQLSSWLMKQPFDEPHKTKQKLS